MSARTALLESSAAATVEGRRGGRSRALTAASVVVPVHGGRALTQRCLDALLADLPDTCETIVVDDASPDSTPELLASYGEAIRVLSLPENVGYARACNAGAEIAGGQVLVFLNNDTEPHPGWLRALTTYARRHPRAAIVGAKLLYPTGTVQHAGVVIGQDGYPHNLYAGLPGDHPAVAHPRRLQAVTGACMLVTRRAFARAGGFDPAYLNSLEDVDLCLRVGADGGEVHYCPDAVVTHIESASRGREGRFEQSVSRYRERWLARARRDDLSRYVEDGLLDVEYRDGYPLRVSISPLLACIDGGREREVERLLERYAAQLSGLLAEVMRLTALIGGGEHHPLAPAGRAAARTFDHRAFLAEASRIEEQVRELQQRLEAGSRAGGLDAGRGGPGSDFTANRRLGYRRLADRVCAAVAEAVPPGASILVVSRGDRDLVRVAEREARHFPQGDDGGYLGHHPRDSEDAIAQLESLRGAGAEHLVLPSIYRWWLEHYAAFAEHLAARYPATELADCTVFHLADRHASTAAGARQTEGRA